MNIRNYHFHLYFDFKTIDIAVEVRDKISRAFDVEVGRLWNKPIGPHPVCSCQVTVPVGLFEDVSVWLLKNRNSIDVFIHPVTGDDISDHKDHIMWIGKSYKLNIVNNK